MKIDMQVYRATKRPEDVLHKMMDDKISDIFYLYSNFRDGYHEHSHFIGSLTADPDLINKEGRTKTDALVYRIDLKESFEGFNAFEGMIDLVWNDKGVEFGVIEGEIEEMVRTCHKEAEACGVADHYRLSRTPCLYMGKPFAVHVLWDHTNGDFLTVMGGADEAEEAAQRMADAENIIVHVHRQGVNPKERVIKAIEDDWDTKIFFMDNASIIKPQHD